jgi:AraC-like DNA-binding protein
MAFLIPSMFLFLALIHLRHNWRIQPHSLYLSGAMVAMAVFYVNFYLFIYGPSVFWLAVFFGHFTPIHLLMGPFLFFYVRGVLTDRHRVGRRDLLHFVPAILDLLSRIPYVRVPWSQKLWMSAEMIRDPNRIHDFSGYFLLSPSVALTLRMLSMIGYTACCLWMVWRFRSHRSSLTRIPPKAARPVIRFLTHLLTVCFFTELSFFSLQVIFLTNPDLTMGYVVSNPLMFLTLLGILSIPVIIQLHPEVLYGIPRWRVPSRKAGSEITPESAGYTPIPRQTALPDDRRREPSDDPDGRARFRELALRIERTMDEQKPFLDPAFSLDDLARLLDVPKHHLYYCFNHILHKKFTQVRAEYRVRHACRQIEAGQMQEKTLEAIGLESGFSSRSSFIIAFREVIGVLPSAYQQSLSAGKTSRVCRDPLS